MSSGRRVAIITGANAGVGRATAHRLASPPHRMHVILACRSDSRGQAAADTIRRAVPDASVECVPLDLSSSASIDACAERILALHEAIDILVNNAGRGGVPAPMEALHDGSDAIYVTNFVGHFRLTLRLMPALARAPTSRVVNLSSVMARFGDPQGWEASLRFRPGTSTYATSKLALAVFSAELGRRASTLGAPRLTAVSVNPGAVNSDIWYRGQLPWPIDLLASVVFRLLFLTTAQAAEVVAGAATIDGNQLGTYFCPYRTPKWMPMPFELHGPFAGLQECSPHPAVAMSSYGAALWRVTARFCGLDG